MREANGAAALPDTASTCQSVVKVRGRHRKEVADTKITLATDALTTLSVSRSPDSFHIEKDYFFPIRFGHLTLNKIYQYDLPDLSLR